MSSVLPPDLMAAISGGGPTDGGSAPASLPPELAALVGGSSPDAAPADAPVSDPGGKDPQAALECLQVIEDEWKKYLDVEPDEEDKLVGAKQLAEVQKLKAKDQKEADGAMQGKATPRLMRKVGSGQAA